MKRTLLWLVALLLTSTGAMAQRAGLHLGRGVVCVASGDHVLVSWRRLAQDDEQARYFVYVRRDVGAWTRLNREAVQTSNLSVAASQVPVGSEVAVSVVEDGRESSPQGSFVRKAQTLRNIYMEIAFEGGPLDNSTVATKYCWPVDLDGDGEMDYVVDRNSLSSDRHYLEAYLASGLYLWTVDLGPNESASSGQDDQITAWDIDCDGRGEVLVQTSDGTRFWDQASATWGLYVGGSLSPDTDGDGIVDYNTQEAKNAPRYMSVVDGMTGAEKAYVEQQYDEAYNRTNKASLMGDEYNKHVGHVGVFYPDGLHPALVMEWHTRTTKGAHQYRLSAFSFFEGGAKGAWHQLFMTHTGGATFHQIRIGDFDGDGRDELSSGAYCMDHDGSTLYNTGLSHGDRHRTSDIDPERPGLETFSIQQDAPDMMGMALFDAATGEFIKKWYLPAVGDVGRGECLDLDPAHKGWEMFSTMDGYQVYDAKGDKVEGLTGYFPTEGIWWDGELDRERVDSPDGSGLNADIRDFRNGRLIEMGKESGYTIKSSNAKRGKFWGDIIGDWREELILNREVNGVNTGIVGFTTDIATPVSNIYCLLQDPHYAGDCTTKGYYQSPNPGFYLGYDMPRPPLPPVFASSDTTQVFALDLGDATIAPDASMKHLYAMPVKGQTLTVGHGLAGGATLWKGQQGTLAVGDLTLPKVVVSEGTLRSDGTLHTLVDLRARGTLAGAATVDSIVFEGALNCEGCRLVPTGDGLHFLRALPIYNKVYVEMSGAPVRVAGMLTVGAPLVFRFAEPLEAGEYTLMTFGRFAGGVENVVVEGLTGLSYTVEQREGGLVLVVHEQREPSAGVAWTGHESPTWDYKAANWTLGDEATEFVAGDEVAFTDAAERTTVEVNTLLPVARVAVSNEAKTYTFKGDGGFTGSATFEKSGQGDLCLLLTKSDYTGPTRLLGGTTTVKLLSDTGTPSSVGAAGTIEIGKATLAVDNTSASTDRPLLLSDTATVKIASGTTALKGTITGAGCLTKAGAGQLNINSAANAWTGGTVLLGGTLAQASWDAAIGRAGSRLDVVGNATYSMFDNNTSSAVPVFQNALSIARGKTLTFRAGSRCQVRGSLEGEGTCSITFPYVRANVSTDCSKFQGTLEVASGTCRLFKALDLSGATLRLGAGVYCAGYKDDKTETAFTHRLGALTSTAADCQLATGTWNAGYLDTNTTYAGQWNAAASLCKYGLGTLTLSGTGEGSLSVCEGTAQLDGTTTGQTTVRQGGTLCGSGQTAALSVQRGGTLAAGKATGVSVGTLHIAGNLTVSAGGQLRARLRVASNGTCRSDAFEMDGTARMSSPTLVLDLVYGDYAAGQAFTVFKGEGQRTLSGTLTLKPAVPAPGLRWDTTDLASEGVVRVVVDEEYDAIGAPRAEDAPHSLYTLNGQKIEHARQKGVYVLDGHKVVRGR